MSTSVGQKVGFKIRFNDATGPKTLIKVMTDGILLAETQGDRLLKAYDTIIIDEAHERSLNIDFLLGYLRRLLVTRDDLRVIITSATGRTAVIQAPDRPLVGSTSAALCTVSRIDGPTSASRAPDRERARW